MVSFLQGVLLLQAMGSSGLRERECVRDMGFEFACREPGVDLFRARLRFGSSGFEHDKSVQRTSLYIEGTHGKCRASIAAGHENHAAPLGQVRNDLIEIRLANRFPINIHSLRSEGFHGGGKVVGLIIHGNIGPQGAQSMAFLRTWANGSTRSVSS